MQSLRLIAMILVVVGALNWGLVGLLQVDLVQMILGGVPLLARLVYILVGLGGIVLLINPETWRRPAALA